jgi:GLPGLI family protein
MKFCIFLLLLIVFHVTVFSQSVISCAAIRYEISKDVFWDGNKIKTLGSTYEVSFNASHLKTVTHLGGDVYFTKISSCKEDESTFFASNGTEFYQMKYKKEIELINMGVFGNSSPSFKYTDETIVINGYNCKKAIGETQFTGLGSGSFEVWYCPDYKVEPGWFNFFFNELKGLPVKFTFIEPSKMQAGGKPIESHNTYTLSSMRQNISNDDAFIVKDTKKYQMIFDDKEKNAVIMRFATSIAIGGSNNVQIPPNANGSTNQASSLTKSNKDIVIVPKTEPFIVGDTLKFFEGKSITGGKLTLSDYTDKVLVVNFWFVFCKPCIAEIPLLNSLKTKYEDKGVGFLSITFDDAKLVNEFLKKNPFVFDMIVNAKNITDQYGIITYPVTIIADKNKVIRYVALDGLETLTEAEAVLIKILNS